MQKAENKIIEAAIEVFTKKGYESTTMQDIAEAAGIGRTTLNYYFRTKENLFLIIFDDILSTLIPELDELLQNKQNIEDRINDFIDIYYKILVKNPIVPRFLILEINRAPKQLHTFIINNKKGKDYLERLKTLLNQERQRKNIPNISDVELIALLYSLMLTPFLLLPLAEQFEVDKNLLVTKHKQNTKNMLISFLTKN